MPTTRGSGNPVMFMQEIPDQRQGVGSSSFQSEKAEPLDDLSTADFKERRDRPSGVRERIEVMLLFRK
uniref:Uncharacterized protein n=1 Tax=Rhizophora mucronata TaxID=61149 RepID=A0A2P2NMJ8_RHIMU